MKNTIQITFLFLLFISISFACKKEDKGSCSSNIICYTDKPSHLYVRLDLSNSPDGKPVLVTFYKGDIDKGEVLDFYTTTSAKETYLMPVNEDYSATAKYVLSNGDTLLVVDGDRLTRPYCNDNDTKCYDWDYELGLDLRIK